MHRWAPAASRRLPSHFTDRTVVTYDPRGVERSDEGRSASSSRRPRARRRPASRHRGDRWRAGRHLRQQWRRRDRAGARGCAPRGRADARRARAALASVVPDREARWPRAVPCTRRTRSGFGAGMAHFIAHREPPGSDDGRVRRPAGPRSGDVRDAGRGRRQPHRCAARAEHLIVHALRARLRRAPRRLDADRPGCRRRVRRRAGVPWRGRRRRASSARRR